VRTLLPFEQRWYLGIFCGLEVEAKLQFLPEMSFDATAAGPQPGAL
jgi:hypothetical protein